MFILWCVSLLEHAIDTLREKIGSIPPSGLRRETAKGGPIYTQRTGRQVLSILIEPKNMFFVAQYSFV